jgi:hypothetical protein
MKDKIYLLIDVAIPSDSNVIQKESEKKLKYKNLSIKIQRMWNMKCFVIPVIIGATGIVTRGLKKYLETIPGKHSTDSVKTKNSCTTNITHYKESDTIRNLKPEWWGSPLVKKENYQENPVKREIIIIIIISPPPGKHSIDSVQKNSCTRNITHYKESATIRNLKPEWWGSPLIQEEKYQENSVKTQR